MALGARLARLEAAAAVESDALALYGPAVGEALRAAIQYSVAHRVDDPNFDPDVNPADRAAVHRVYDEYLRTAWQCDAAEVERRLAAYVAALPPGVTELIDEGRRRVREQFGDGPALHQ
jgi:hypothetical protein